MEDLKQYRVDFRVTYHCIGRKGFFRKKEYAFDWINQYDEHRTSICVNSRTPSRAFKKAKIIATKHANYLVEQAKKVSNNEFLHITGTTQNGEFKWSPRVFDITGFEIELVTITHIRTWKEEKVNEAMKKLSIEEFKSVFGETFPQQEED